MVVRSHDGQEPGNNPYKPTHSEEPKRIRPIVSLSATSLFLLLTAIGCFTGYGGAIIGSVGLEQNIASHGLGNPRLTYGQQAGLITMPLCALMGAGIGFALAMATTKHSMAAAALLLANAGLGWVITSSLWNQQIEQYGRDASEIVLYYPLVAMSFVSLSFVVVLFPLAIFLRGRVSPRPNQG